jgi:hypothetical protein
MTVENHKLVRLSEHVAKLDKALPIKICRSLSSSIYESSTTDISFNDADVELLSDMQSELFLAYRNDYFPKVEMSGDSNEYSLELDFINIEPNSEMRLYCSGDGASQRFVSFMFFTDVIGSGIEITLNNNENLGVFKVGDVLIFPPYYDHLLCFKTGDEERFSSVTLHACMSY